MDLQRFNEDQRGQVEWPPGSSLVWLAIPVAALYCVSETWTPLVVLFTLMAIPGGIILTLGTILWIFSVMEIAWKAFARWLARPPARPLQQQQDSTPVTISGGMACETRVHLFSPSGALVDCDDGLTQRAGMTLQLTEREKQNTDFGDNAAIPRLKRYVMGVAAVCYGPDKKKMAHVMSTVMEFASDGEEKDATTLTRVESQNWYQRFTDLGVWFRWYAKEIPRPTMVSEDEQRKDRDDFVNYKRKSARRIFLDRHEYSSGHYVVRAREEHSYCSVERDDPLLGRSVKTRIL